MSTRIAIMEEVIKRTRLGVLLTCTTTDTSNDEFTDSSIRNIGGDTTILTEGAPFIITNTVASGPTIGAASRYSSLSTATITVSPDTLGAKSQATNTAAVLHPVLEHPDNVYEAINRALTERCSYWARIPLTLLNDGDMEASVTTAYTASAGTTTAAKTAFAFPYTWGTQYMAVTNAAGANGYMYQAVNCSEDDVYHLVVVVRAHTGTAEITVYDVTSSAAITLTGDDNTTAVGGWTILRFQFTVPSSCRQFQVRLGASGASDVADYAAAILWREDAKALPFQTRIRSDDMVGDDFFYQREGGSNEEDATDPQLAPWGRGVSITETGVGLTAQFDTAIGSRGPIFYQERRHYAALTTATADSICPDNYINPAAAFEVVKMAWMAEERKGTLPKPEGYVNPFGAPRPPRGLLAMMWYEYLAADRWYGAVKKGQRRKAPALSIG